MACLATSLCRVYNTSVIWPQSFQLLLEGWNWTLTHGCNNQALPALKHLLSIYHIDHFHHRRPPALQNTIRDHIAAKEFLLIISTIHIKLTWECWKYDNARLWSNEYNWGYRFSLMLISKLASWPTVQYSQKDFIKVSGINLVNSLDRTSIV